VAGGRQDRTVPPVLMNSELPAKVLGEAIDRIWAEKVEISEGTTKAHLPCDAALQLTKLEEENPAPEANKSRA